MLDREPSSGEIYAVPFQPQDFASAQTVQGGDLYKGIDGIIPDRVKQGLELVGAVVAGFIPLLFRKLDKLTGIRLQHAVFHRLIQGLEDNILILPQRRGRQAALSVFAASCCLFIEKGLQIGSGDLLKQKSALIEIGDHLGVCHQLIALKGHRIHSALRDFQPCPDVVRKQDIAHGPCWGSLALQ